METKPVCVQNKGAMGEGCSRKVSVAQLAMKTMEPSAVATCSPGRRYTPAPGTQGTPRVAMGLTMLLNLKAKLIKIRRYRKISSRSKRLRQLKYQHSLLGKSQNKPPKTISGPKTSLRSRTSPPCTSNSEAA